MFLCQTSGQMTKEIIVIFIFSTCILISDDPTSQTFDTSLMICLLRNLAGIQIPNELPFWLDLSVGVDLLKIMTYRKDISNSIDRTFQYEKFTAIWKEIEDVRRPFFYINNQIYLIFLQY